MLPTDFPPLPLPGRDGQIGYYITGAEPEESRDMFFIDEDTGYIRVAEPLDYETIPVHRLDVTVQDNALIPAENTRLFTIYVTVSI